MIWRVLFREHFTAWLDEQDKTAKRDVLAMVSLLAKQGPNLVRPYADSVQGSKFSNMKELRVQTGGHPVRAFFAFDPARQAIILCAGDKSGDEKRFYKVMIPLADKLYREYLEEKA